MCDSQNNIFWIQTAGFYNYFQNVVSGFLFQHGKNIASVFLWWKMLCWFIMRYAATPLNFKMGNTLCSMMLLNYSDCMMCALMLNNTNQNFYKPWNMSYYVLFLLCVCYAASLHHVILTHYLSYAYDDNGISYCKTNPTRLDILHDQICRKTYIL